MESKLVYNILKKNKFLAWSSIPLYKVFGPSGFKLLEIENKKIYFDSSDPSIYPKVKYSSYEGLELQLLKSLSDKEKVFADIGANTGLYSILLSDYYKKILAFEPLTEFYTKITEAKKLNNITNLEAYNMALIERIAYIPFKKDFWGSGGSRVSSLGIRSQLVNAYTLDNIMVRENIPRIDVIKLDVEGSELLTLRGATKVLGQTSLTLVIEFNPIRLKRLKQSPLELLNFLKYHFPFIRVINEVSKSLEPLPEFLERYANLVCQK